MRKYEYVEGQTITLEENQKVMLEASNEVFTVIGIHMPDIRLVDKDGMTFSIDAKYIQGVVE